MRVVQGLFPVGMCLFDLQCGTLHNANYAQHRGPHKIRLAIKSTRAMLMKITDLMFLLAPHTHTMSLSQFFILPFLLPATGHVLCVASSVLQLRTRRDRVLPTGVGALHMWHSNYKLSSQFVHMTYIHTYMTYIQGPKAYALGHHIHTYMRRVVLLELARSITSAD